MSSSAEAVPRWPRWTLVGIAVLEAVALIGYGLVDGVVALTQGITGPEQIASPAGVLVQVVVLVALGAGMLAIARGWWRRLRWARAPFVLAQLILGFILFSLAQASGSAVAVIGVIGLVVAVVGLVVALLPVSRRETGVPGD